MSNCRRVLLVHNQYLQRGGEDAVVEAEAQLLEKRGHVVEIYGVSNAAVDGMTSLALASQTVWSPEHREGVYRAARRLQADIVHVHNTLPLLSPAVYYGARDAGAGVVQTLHNYRLGCVNGLFFREGKACDKCMNLPIPLWGIAHACYRDSRAASSVVAAMLAIHKLLGTYRRVVDVYVALTEFARRMAIKAGVPQEAVMVKPNYVPDTGSVGDGEGDYFLYVGRLSEEKGVRVLLDAWRMIKVPARLRIVGEGPLADVVESASIVDSRIEWYGWRDKGAVLEQMRDAIALIAPSICFEVLPLSVLEAMSVGTPTIASTIGSLETLVAEGVNGYRFEVGEPAALARIVDRVYVQRSNNAKLRRSTRQKYESSYSEDANYHALCDVYEAALRNLSSVR